MKLECDALMASLKSFSGTEGKYTKWCNMLSEAEKHKYLSI